MTSHRADKRVVAEVFECVNDHQDFSYLFAIKFSSVTSSTGDVMNLDYVSFDSSNSFLFNNSNQNLNHITKGNILGRL